MTYFQTENRQDYETPPEFFHQLNDVFNFNLDCAASDRVHKLESYFKISESAFENDWVADYRTDKVIKGRCFCNPPYDYQKAFILKGIEQIGIGNSLYVVYVIPVATDTKLWQDIIFPNASAICFVNGRIHFLLDQEQKQSNTRGTALVIFSGTNIDGMINKLRSLNRFKNIINLHNIITPDTTPQEA